MRPLHIGPSRVWAWLLVWAALSGCGEGHPGLPPLGPNDIVLAFGDSLTYGTGAQRGESYPEILSGLIGRTVVAEGVPGERTAEGLVRLAEVLELHQPRIMLLCLGGNDMLRKVDAGEIEKNLRQMIETAMARGVGVVLIGVPKPALLGDTAQFYQRIAADYEIPYEGNVLNRILRDEAYKSDAIHPNARGYQMLAAALAELLKRSGAI
ncbi:MAG: arylesterase [Burkholderiales bacterium]|nr:arylesterase [Burkholderiales bacterium]